MTTQRWYGYWEPISPYDQAMLAAFLAAANAEGLTERTDEIVTTPWHVVRLAKPTTPIPTVPLPLGPSETGIDWSHWNHNGQVIDFAKVRTAGHRFGWGKRTQGTDFVDPLGQQNKLAAATKLDFIGDYHFFEWWKDGTEQADHFSRTVGEFLGNLPEMGDFELRNGEDPATVNKAVATANLRKFLARCEQRFLRKPINYTNKRSWEAMFENVADIERDYDFLVADWTPPINLPGGVRWARFHQKSNVHRIPGLNGDFDLIEYKGNPPPVPIHTMRDKTNQQVLNLFWGVFASWSQLTRAIPSWGTTMAASLAMRNTLYAGPAIEDFDLTPAEKNALIAALG